ncbi:condensation domain-containing protein [Egbenema bharatensis]|uniref:condensation domain-containing protein n=1 Tax=Egbenema bharatensis TaxID=3463334 RepID=UPI003A891ACB
MQFSSIKEQGLSAEPGQSKIAKPQLEATKSPTELGFWRTARTNSKLRRHSPPIQAVPRDQPLPLSHNQQRLWNLEQLHPARSVQNLLHTFHLSGTLNHAALQESLQTIIQRHEILRTRFATPDGLDGQVVQSIEPTVALNLPIIDLQPLPPEQQRLALQQLSLAQADQPFDLSHCPLWRFQLLQLSPTEHVLIRTIHHIIFDGWSHTVFLRELGLLYGALAAGAASPLLELPVQYADFAHTEREWLKDENLSLRLDYWQQQLSGAVAAVELPIDHPRSGMTSYEGACQSFVLSPEVSQGLKALSYQAGVSLFVTLFSAFNLLLHCYSQQRDLLVCTPVAGRHRAETKGMIGYFNNLLVLRTLLSSQMSVREVLQQVSQVSLQAYEYQDLPLQRVAELANLARVPLTRAMFVLQNTPNPSLELGELQVRSEFVMRAIADFEISLSMQEQSGQLEGALQYKTALFNSQTIAQFIERFQFILNQLVNNPDVRLSELPQFAGFNPAIALSGANFADPIADLAPRTPIEQQLTQIWQDLLELQSISIKANFFELGGYSLLAVRLFQQIEAVLGKTLPLSTLVSAPTIEQLAAVLEGTQSQASGSVVLLQAGTAEPPLFLLHDGDGEILLYRNLAHHLPGRTVYGIQPCSTPEQPILHSRIRDMADAYIEQIQAVQPQGPYLLGGLCAGGILAFEVARQLQQQGQTVAMVAIIDAADVKAAKRTGRVAGERLSSFSKSFMAGEQMSAHQRALFVVNKVRQKVTNLIAYEVTSKVQILHKQMRLQLFRYYLDQGLPLPRLLQQIPVREVFMFAEQDYSPESCYDGELLLFRATQKVLDAATAGVDDEPYINIYSDPLLGWEPRSTCPVRVFDVPGGHSSMLQEPYVAVMAEQMQFYLDLALSQKSQSDQFVA